MTSAMDDHEKFVPDLGHVGHREAETGPSSDDVSDGRPRKVGHRPWTLGHEVNRDGLRNRKTDRP